MSGASGIVVTNPPRTGADFPVRSRAVSAEGAVKETLGSVNTPVVCGGRLVEPGDVIVADDDGVVVVRRVDAEEVLAASLARENKEARLRARYAEGEFGLDVNSMRERLARRGLRYVDHDEYAKEVRDR